MAREDFTFQGHNNVTIAASRWLPSGETRAVLQVFHGMAEHIKRYESLAKALNEAGIALWGEDHRGHGATSELKGAKGHLGPEDSWEFIVEDNRALTELIAKENPEKPLFVMGHSMGSFILRQYLAKYSDFIKGAIISGTGFIDTLTAGMPGLIGSMQSPDKPSKLLDNLSFGSFNKPFKPNRTDFDWLSRNEAEVDKYIADPFCGFICTAGFFRQFSKGLTYISKKEAFQAPVDNLPLLFISGENDPVGGKRASGMRKVARKYAKAGKSHILIKVYPGARHECLNETNRDEVIKDIMEWLESLLS